MKMTSKSAVFSAALVMGISALVPVNSAAYAQNQNDAAQNDVVQDEETQSNAYSDLYAAMRSGIDEETELDAMLANVADALVRIDPDSSSLEAIYPGAMKAVTTGMRPAFKLYSQRVTAEFKPQMIQILSEELTEEEAIAASAIYSSDIGKKLMSSAAANHSGDAMISEGLAEDDVSQSAVTQDIENASKEAVASLALKERLQFAASIGRTPGLGRKINLLKPRILALRTEMENAPMTPEEEVLMNSGGEEALLAFIAESDAAFADADAAE